MSCSHWRIVGAAKRLDRWDGVLMRAWPRSPALVNVADRGSIEGIGRNFQRSRIFFYPPPESGSLRRERAPFRSWHGRPSREEWGSDLVMAETAMPRRCVLPASDWAARQVFLVRQSLQIGQIYIHRLGTGGHGFSRAEFRPSGAKGGLKEHSRR